MTDAFLPNIISNFVNANYAGDRFLPNNGKFNLI